MKCFSLGLKVSSVAYILRYNSSVETGDLDIGCHEWLRIWKLRLRESDPSECICRYIRRSKIFILKYITWGIQLLWTYIYFLKIPFQNEQANLLPLYSNLTNMSTWYISVPLHVHRYTFAPRSLQRTGKCSLYFPPTLLSPFLTPKSEVHFLTHKWYFFTGKIGLRVYFKG